MGTVDPMKPDDLLDYALGQFEGPAKDTVESAIADDPDLSFKADRLALTLGLLLDDGDEIEPPAGLASKTVAFVADRASKRAILDFVPARVPFRWADLAVAAGVLMAGLLTLLPAMNATRNKVNQMGCGFNLQQLGSSLANYAIRHNHYYPDVVSTKEDAPVGSYAVALKDADLLRDSRSLHCPCNGLCLDLESSTPDPQHIDYAYNIGYRHQGTKEAEPARLVPAAIPLLADQPSHADGQILPGNSPNHGFRGQNVLFSDLHIEWFSSRHVKTDRDLFLNNHNLPEPGTAHDDAALVPAVFQIDSH
jgi:hypothetical protein